MRPELFAAPLFIPGLLPGSNSPKMGDDIGPVSDDAGSDAAFRNGRQELLGAPASDAQQRLQSRAVNPRLRAEFELTESLGKAVQPEGFIWHEAPL